MKPPVNLHIDPDIYNERRCTGTTNAGMPCRLLSLEGYHTCLHHLPIKDKQKYLEIKKDTPKSKPIERESCFFIKKNGEQCGTPSMIGYKSCFHHATPTERRDYRKSRRKNKDTSDHYQAKYAGGRKKGIGKQHKPYDGHRATVRGETVVEVKDGTVYGYYGGVFITERERELFRTAPVGDIEDDIRIIRYLIRDALENQALFIRSRDEGNVSNGFILFSKEVAETIDEGGRVIAAHSRTIKRRHDYLEEIHKLEKLLVTMEQARIEINKANKEDDETVNPFSFNVLPPSEDHPIYGVDEEPEDGVEEGGIQ